MKKMTCSMVAFTVALILTAGCARPTPNRSLGQSAVISKELAVAKERQTKMRDTYSDQHPDMKEQMAAIASLEQSLMTPGETLALAKARERLARLRVNFADAHPDVQRLLAYIESLEKSAAENDPPELAEAKATLASLRINFSEKHPAVQSQLKEVADLQE
jgi:capsule polysaccharide export protein KpsE/RkpR